MVGTPGLDFLLSATSHRSPACFIQLTTGFSSMKYRNIPRRATVRIQGEMQAEGLNLRRPQSARPECRLLPFCHPWPPSSH